MSLSDLKILLCNVKSRNKIWQRTDLMNMMIRFHIFAFDIIISAYEFVGFQEEEEKQFPRRDLSSK